MLLKGDITIDQHLEHDLLILDCKEQLLSNSYIKKENVYTCNVYTSLKQLLKIDKSHIQSAETQEMSKSDPGPSGSNVVSMEGSTTGICVNIKTPCRA